MDLSIRVIALILSSNLRRFASRHPHLSVVQIVKEPLSLPAAPARFSRQQQRSEIMRQLQNSVKPLLYFSFHPAWPRQTGKPRHRRRAAHYIEIEKEVNTPL